MTDQASSFLLAIGLLLGAGSKPDPPPCVPMVRYAQAVCPGVPFECKYFGWYRDEKCNLNWVEILP